MRRDRALSLKERKQSLSFKHEGEMSQEACLFVGGDPVGSELVSVAWGISESVAPGTVGGFVPIGLLGGSAISAG